MTNGRGWGQDATLAPGWVRVGQAALNAAASPETWGPAAGALVFQVDDADRKVTKWAAGNTPVFGSQERADRMSYDLRDAAGALWIASAVAAPSGDRAEDWLIAKAEGLGVQEGAGVFMRGTVSILKDGTDRARPNGIGRGSFPSAHATGAAFYATLASRNLDALQWSPALNAASQLGLGAITAATAWARLEANQHYPSDVLGGIALGHFLGAFFTEAFVGLDNPRKVMMVVEPSREGVVAMLRFNF